MIITSEVVDGNSLINYQIEKISTGEDLGTDLTIKFSRENTKLLKFAIDVMGKLPTNAKQTGNGPFTHPVVTSNLLVEHLSLHLLLRQRARDLEQSVRKRALPVVDVRHDAEVSDVATVDLGHRVSSRAAIPSGDCR